MKQNKNTRTTVETIIFTREEALAWELPPFQRPLRINAKVIQVSEKIKEDGGVIPGVLTLGVVDRRKYLLDGQHRRAAFDLTELLEGYADVRTCFFDCMADMGEEFVNLNSRLVVMRPDDVLRGLEDSLPSLVAIRKACPFVGYDQVRRSGSSAVLSMSALLRSWRGSANDSPGATGGDSAATLAKNLTQEESALAIRFLTLAAKAWGREPEYHRLWLALNLTMCAWLYRRIVVSSHSALTKRISEEQFCKCLMSLSADSAYVDWLLGRSLGDRDRSPAYMRIKTIFSGRLLQDTGVRYRFPKPVWATH